MRFVNKHLAASCRTTIILRHARIDLRLLKATAANKRSSNKWLVLLQLVFAARQTPTKRAQQLLQNVACESFRARAKATTPTITSAAAFT